MCERTPSHNYFLQLLPSLDNFIQYHTFAVRLPHSIPFSLRFHTMLLPIRITPQCTTTSSCHSHFLTNPHGTLSLIKHASPRANFRLHLLERHSSSVSAPAFKTSLSTCLQWKGRDILNSLVFGPPPLDLFSCNQQHLFFNSHSD
jgi:hypothetical protein